MNNKILSIIVGTFTSFCLIAGGVYYFNQNESNSPNRETQSQKKPKASKTDRDLELGIISDIKTEISNEPSALFNDPAIKQAWGLKKTDAARAWSVSKGSKKVIVAVIDTGIDIHHEDLKDNLWLNPGETGLDAKGKDKATNRIDDDGNGFIDDVYGWNFVSNNNKLDDNHGHGTHIAGIIGAEGGNKKGIVGISPEVSLMVLKYFDPKVPNTDNLKNTIQAINYAVKMGAHIINYSGGGTEYSQEEHDAVQSAERKGILFVAAAGNEHSNSDENHYYPADYKLKNIISVTAIDPTTEVLSSSNFGVDTVDLAAPGQAILSCLPNNTYGLMTGTSQATAFVTGAGVLVMANKDLYSNPEEVKKFILATGDSSESLQTKTKTAKQLNLFKSLTILDQSTSISGIRSRESLDKSVYASKTLDTVSTGETNDPNNKKQINQIAGFGADLIKAMNSTNKKPKQKDRLGTKSENNEN